MSELTGLRALVTGGASGIGKATAALLAARGAKVAVLDLDPSAVEKPLRGYAADVSDDASVRSAVAAAASDLGGLDILVNNAGIGAAGTVEENDDAQWHRVLDVNVLGIVRTTRAALPHLRASSHAAIVNTCSIAATAGLPQRALYSASKGAVQSLTLAMAADHVREGVRVNCVNPGTADTPWVGRLLDRAADPAAERAALRARQPMGRLVTAEEVAAAIVYLASPAAASVTGTALAVDGGMQGLRLRPGGAVMQPDGSGSARTLPHRTLGRSGVPVTALGFGAAAIGGLYEDVGEDEAAAAVDAAWDAGMRYFDTAPHYGLGLSERRLGEALRARPRDSFTLSTKVGRVLVPYDGGGDDRANGFAVPATHRRRWDFSADGVRRSLDDSLTRLGVDRVDLVLLHDPDDHGEQAFREAYPALEELRAQGVVRAIGAGMNRSGMLARFLTDTDVDAVLCAGRYTLLEQGALHALLPAASATGKSVIVGGVFNSGLLADPRPGATYDYGAAPEDVLRRALRMRDVTESHGVPLRAAALRFPFGHPSVASVLVGARSAPQTRDAAEQFGRPLPDAVWEDLRVRELLAGGIPVPEGGVS